MKDDTTMANADDKISKLNKKFSNSIVMKHILIFCMLSILINGNCAWNTSLNYRYVPGNIYHSSSLLSSSSRRKSHVHMTDDAVYVKNIDDLMLNVDSITAIWYQYDYQCTVHPDGKPVELGSDSHGRWYSHIPRSTGYIGYRRCNFEKRLHYICCRVGNQTFKIEYTPHNFDRLAVLMRSKFRLQTHDSEKHRRA